MTTADNTVALKATILGIDIVDIPDVPWVSGMNAQAALEAAYNTKEDPGFLFSLEYYGTSLGYFVEEIEQIGDQPGVYWEFFVNGVPADHGIDQVTLNAGDLVSFTYTYYSPAAKPASAQLAAKHTRVGRGR
jgi:hypothetical protein